MHPDFADWYRRVQIEPKADELEKRWQAIEAFHKKAMSADLVDAAKVFFGQVPKDEQFLPKYRAEFKNIDGAFPMRDNDAELQVLAGATLANHFEGGDEWSSMAALALACGACEGARKSPVPEIVDLARRTLRGQSSALRAPKKKIVIPSLDLSDKNQNLKSTLGNAGANLQTLQGPLLDVLLPLTKAVISVTNWARQAEIAEGLRQEELDILWWLFGERSRDLDVPFNELNDPSGCIIGAKEVADLTRVLPGPFGVEAYLHKMLSLAGRELEGTVTLSDAVAACPPEWQAQFVNLEGLNSVADLCPIHLAVQKSVEAGGKKAAWSGPFQTVSGLKATMKLKPILLALQTYRERLFLVALGQHQESSDE